MRKIKKIGKVIHYFDKIGVAVVKVQGELKKGEKIRVSGATTDFEQTIASMEVDHKRIAKAVKGQEIGMKVKERVRKGDVLYIEDGKKKAQVKKPARKVPHTKTKSRAKSAKKKSAKPAKKAGKSRNSSKTRRRKVGK